MTATAEKQVEEKKAKRAPFTAKDGAALAMFYATKDKSHLKPLIERFGDAVIEAKAVELGFVEKVRKVKSLAEEDRVNIDKRINELFSKFLQVADAGEGERALMMFRHVRDQAEASRKLIAKRFGLEKIKAAAEAESDPPDPGPEDPSESA